MSRLDTNLIKSIFADTNFGVCYEPIIDMSDMSIFGYEALGRFKNDIYTISPYDFFKSIHNDTELFFYTESILKEFQIANRPKDTKIFLNLDPDVAIESKHISHWIKLFSSNKDIVIEITENSDNDNADDVERFMDWMDKFGINYAYDDYGQPNTMFFASLLHRASFIKLDINFLRTIRKNSAYIEMAKGVVNYAKKSNKKTILEGIETLQDLEVAKKIDVDCVQGYFFNEKFITIWS